MDRRTQDRLEWEEILAKAVKLRRSQTLSLCWNIPFAIFTFAMALLMWSQGHVFSTIFELICCAIVTGAALLTQHTRRGLDKVIEEANLEIALLL